jgi:hypothetical protein
VRRSRRERRRVGRRQLGGELRPGQMLGLVCSVQQLLGEGRVTLRALSKAADRAEKRRGWKR